MIRESLQKVQQQIQDVCQRCGCDSKDITLVGISKYADATLLQEAIDAGLTHIGENRVQDAQAKFADLQTDQVTKHLVGHLQSNKAKLAVQLFDVIESVDSLKIAQALNKEAGKINKRQNILIQVNTSGEEQKSGVSKEEALNLIKEIQKLEHLHLQGLMTMAPFENDGQNVRQTFRDLRMIFEQANATLDVQMDVLSMGMSGDFEIALEEGSNMLRIGSAIFLGDQ